MADKKLNSVSPVTDAAYVYAETSNGDTVKISKADLASVVAGLRYKRLSVMDGIACGGTVTVKSVDYGMKDRYVVFVNEEIGYNALVQIRYGKASVVHETESNYYSFSVAPSSDMLNISVLYSGARGKTLSYMAI